MKMVALQLHSAGWKQEDDYTPPADKGSSPKKIFSKGDQRAYIGPVWTTFYNVPTLGHIEGDMHSIKTDDLASVQQFVLGG